MVKKKRWHCLPGQPVTELDKQVMFWENKGKLVPTRDLIKTPEQIEGIRKSGVVNTGCLDAVAEMIRPGINTQQIDDLCMQYCKDHNAIPACLNYEGYPKSVCTSINEVVCHGIPKEEDVLEEGDIVNVDMTTIVDGYYADASRMFIVGGKTTPEKEQLVRVAKECLELGMEVLSLTLLWAISVMLSRSIARSMVMVLSVTSVVMESAVSSMRSLRFCIMVIRVQVCCLFLVWYSLSSQ